jgi:adenosylmethionine-8-amino-7-oxononanoate aminotransferase
MGQIQEKHTVFAGKIKGYDVVRNVRLLGTVIAFEIEAGVDGYFNSIGLDLTRAALDEGIYLRPLGNTVYILPPYCITEEELEKVYGFLERYLNKQKAR